MRSTSQPCRIATTPNIRRGLPAGRRPGRRPGGGSGARRSSSGSTMPGNSGVESGNSGMTSLTADSLRCSGHYPGDALPRPARRWPVLARIDLRGSALPGPRALAGLVPRAGTDIDSVLATVRPLCEDVRDPRRRGRPRDHRPARRRRRRGLRRPGRGAAAGPRRVRPGAAGRARGGRRPGPPVHADQRRTDVTTQVAPGGHGDRALAAGAPGRASTCPAAWPRCCPAW